jgi:hypothetical protein
VIKLCFVKEEVEFHALASTVDGGKLIASRSSNLYLPVRDMTLLTGEEAM